MFVRSSFVYVTWWMWSVVSSYFWLYLQQAQVGYFSVSWCERAAWYNHKASCMYIVQDLPQLPVYSCVVVSSHIWLITGEVKLVLVCVYRIIATNATSRACQLQPWLNEYDMTWWWRKQHTEEIRNLWSSGIARVNELKNFTLAEYVEKKWINVDYKIKRRDFIWHRCDNIKVGPRVVNGWNCPKV